MPWTNSADGLRTLMAGAAAGVLAYSALPALAQSPKIGDPPEAKNMRLVGHNDLQARSADDPNYRSTTRDVRRLIGELQAEGGVDALVLDLRGDGGGFLPRRAQAEARARRQDSWEAPVARSANPRR